MRSLFLAGTLFLSVLAHANVSSELNGFVKNLGITSNVTGSSTYETQAAGMVSFGSINARNQVRSFQVMHMDTPSLRSGCGGIDIIAGGFSIIKAKELIENFQSVLSAGAGYAFNLALETELPTIAHALQFMQSLEQRINDTNMNTCAIGESLVGGMWPKNRAAQQQICQDLSKYKGEVSDWAQARQECSTGGKLDEYMEMAKNDKEYKDRVLSDTNVIWDVLRKHSFLARDNHLAEAYMSMSGTIVFDKKGAMSTYPSLLRNRDFIKALLYGGKLPIYQCVDIGADSHCLNIKNSGQASQTIKPSDALVTQIQTQLEGIYNHIKEDTALDEGQKGLISMTQPSVFRMISANAEQGIGLQGGYELAQNMAVELLQQFLGESLNIVQQSLAGKDLGKENQEIIIRSIERSQQYVSDFGKETREKFNSALMTNKLIQENVKQSMLLLAPVLRQNYKGPGSA